MQGIDKGLFEDFEAEQKKALEELAVKSKTINSGRAPEGSWTERIVEKVRISELASEQGIDCCPNCRNYIRFNDSRGHFICSYSAWSGKQKCDFFGNIVDFVEKIGGLK